MSIHHMMQSYNIEQIRLAKYVLGDPLLVTYDVAVKMATLLVLYKLNLCDWVKQILSDKKWDEIEKVYDTRMLDLYYENVVNSKTLSIVDGKPTKVIVVFMCVLEKLSLCDWVEQIAKLDPDNPFRCAKGCACGADPDEGCNYRVTYFEVSCGIIYKMFTVLWVLDIIHTSDMNSCAGYEMHDLIEPLMIEEFK